MGKDMGVSADADRAVVNGAGQAGSALRASVPDAEYCQTEGQLRARFRTLLKGRGAPTKFAAEHGLVDEQVLAFLSGRRPPEPKLLDAIGYRREYRYSPCGCFRCTKARTSIAPGQRIFGQPLEMMRMFLCETCGNKRCPRAADHRLPCTNSNAPEQAGSLYADAQGMSAGTAETAQQAQGEARQSGPSGCAHNQSESNQ